MKRKDIDALLKMYLPERQWVTRVGNDVYRLKLPEVVIKGAQVVKMRKWKMFRTLRARIGVALMDYGTSLIEAEWSKRYKPYNEVFDEQQSKG